MSARDGGAKEGSIRQTFRHPAVRPIGEGATVFDPVDSSSACLDVARFKARRPRRI